MGTSFWTKSTGEKATGDVKENTFDNSPIPVSWQTCLISEIAIKEWPNDRYINIKMQIMGGQYQNRIIFPKLKVFETESEFYTVEGRDSAIDKLVKLANILGVKMPDDEPDDAWLSKLADKVIDVHFGVWKDNDTKEPKGNFILNFAAKGEKAGPPAASKGNAIGGKTVAAKPAPSAADLDDGIPF